MMGKRKGNEKSLYDLAEEIRDQEIDVDEHPFNHMSLSKVIPSR